MSDSHDNQNQVQAVALFRYGLIADLLHLEPGQRGLVARLREKAEREYDIPGTLRRRVAVETLRDWLQAYRRGGFDALLPRPRADRGVVRALEQHVADQLCSLKEQQPALSVSMLIQHARAQGVVGQDTPLAHATVHRLLVRHGLMDKLTTKPTSNDCRHFAFQKANQLWMSDVMHGPAVMGESRRKQRSYLIALLDDATRVVPFAAFAASENVAAFQSVFEQALRRRGTPQRLYVDNGSAFRSHQLALVCAKLGVTLIHARPYQPQGKGKLERWFRTVRMRLLPFLSQHDTQSLDALNRRRQGDRQCRVVELSRCAADACAWPPARYTRRIAISETRLVRYDGERVTFRWRDRAHGNRVRLATLDGPTFCRRILRYVLLPRFVRIRRYGILSNRVRGRLLDRCRTLIDASATAPTARGPESRTAACLRLFGADPSVCPTCHKGHLVMRLEWGPTRRPVNAILRTVLPRAP